jgi:aminocarboxymuconate-semialdehyde decarboxylase
MEFAVRFFGPDHVMYGSDYPCWMPADALRFFNEVGLPEDVQQKILSGNARRILQLDAPVLVTA